ncbi:MAG TPA: prepilin-type N-terminal cleavage/methylation domain-containing protein [Mycobacteriales bacterium]|jgi:prepilin-type N-terminal cleavage/methylation domain-containing protein|nr:prepilin-type N-terminal cleavage/methylation domain-containing protein [Mycobacteriales bacterium]
MGYPVRESRAQVGQRDGGMTLIEILVALAIVGVGVLALLGELAAYIKQQGLEKSQATALHIADSALESARGMNYASLVDHAGTTTSSTPVHGVTYIATKTFRVCSPTDSPNACTSPANGAISTVHADITVRWSFAGKSHTIRVAQSVSDSGALTVSSSKDPLGNCGGNGTTLVVGHLALSPTSVTVSSAGLPSSAVTATLTQTGLSNASCVPLTWSDDNGPHQVSMTGSGSTYSVTIPAASITKTVATGGGSIPFSATVPGSQAVPSTSLAIVGAPAFAGSCKIQVLGLGLNVITLTPLTRNTLLPAGLSCTTTNLSKNDTVVATYQSGTTTKNISLTSTDGSSWSATLPSGSAMVKTGVSEGFTFALTRAGDGATASQNVTATLA